MNYCQFRNLTIKRMANAGGGGGLPSIYQQVEYLYSNGNPYIVTDFAPVNRYKLEMVGTFENIGIYMWGALIQPSGKQASYGIYRNTDGANKFQFANPNSTNSSYTWTAIANANANVHTFIEDWISPLYSVDNDSVTPNDYYLSYSSCKLALFGRAKWNNGGIDHGKGKIYSCKIWDSPSNIVNDFVPVYRIADDKPGLFELVTQTFYTNAGSGEFTVGPDV